MADELLAEILFDDMASLVACIKARRVELGLSQLALDDLAGLPSGYTGKLESDPARKNYRGVGYVALPLLLGALGIKMAVVKPANGRGSKRCFEGRKPIAFSALKPYQKNSLMAERGRKGGLSRWKKLTPDQQRAALITLAKQRAAKRALRKREMRDKARQSPSSSPTNGNKSG